MYVTNFVRGDLLDYRSNLPTNIKKKLNQKFPEFARCKNNVRCIFIKMVDAELCEVFPCTLKTKSMAASCFDTELIGQRNNVLACSQKIYTVKASLFSLSRIYPLVDPSASIEIIFQKRRSEKIRKQNEKIEKHNQIIIERQKKNELYRLYRNAVISNDRAEMDRLIKELGYEPIEGGLSSNGNKTQYTINNPKPYFGGKFTPK